DLGRVASTTDERSNITRYEYQPGCGCADRITKITDPLGHITQMTYDALGRKTSMTDAAGHLIRYGYDARGHLTDTFYANNTNTHDDYDGRGRHVLSRDQMGKTTQYG